MKKLIFLILFVSSFVSHANDGLFKDYLVQSPSIEPPSRGTLKGDFSEVSDRALTPRTGSFAISLPLSFPSERGGMQAPYKVDYSPGYGISEYGIGWSARLRVSRFKEIGKISYDDSDDLLTPYGQFVLGNDGYYYSKDIKDQMRALVNGDELNIFLKDGTVAKFGSSTDPIYTEKTNAGDVHTWFLRESVDQVGKTTRFEYQNFEAVGRAYLTRILYGGLLDNFQYQVDFSYQKNQRPFISYHTGSKLLSSYRVSTVSVKSKEGASFQERYKDDLIYTLGDESPAFYLKSMTRTFHDGSTLPTIGFDYDIPKNYLVSANWKRETSLDALASQFKGILTFNSQTSTPDFNNDGRPDLEIGRTYERYVQTDNGFEEYNIASANDPSGRCLFPVVSDRRARQFFQPLGPNTENFVYDRFSVGNKSYLEYCHVNGDYVDTIELPKFWDDPQTTIFFDVNDDTLPDLIHLRGNVYQVALNNSENNVVSFAEPSAEVPIRLPRNFYGFWMRDMNGDGQADLVLKGDSALFVHYGDAQGGFTEDFTFFSFYLPSGARNSKNLKDGQILFADLNKDGLPDILLQGDGYVSLHINTGDSFIQLYVPGLFASPQFFRNMMIADLNGDGNQQIAASILQGSETFVATLDLDRPSLGMLERMNDGQGNIIEFGYGKVKAQVGVQSRKTVTTSLLSKSTGEADFQRTVEYGDIATHSLTKSFLAFNSFESIVPSRGTVKKTYAYGNRNLPELLKVEKTDFLRPNVKEVSSYNWESRFTAGIEFPQKTAASMGYTNSDGSVSSLYTETMSYDGQNICETSKNKSGNGLSLSTTTSYFNLSNFSDHLDCLVNTVSMIGTASDALFNFNHNLSLSRDSFGRVTQVDIGLSPVTTLQSITYGANERIASITKPGQGTTSVFYDSSFRTNQIINPDLTENHVLGFEFVNDKPLQTSLKRGLLSFDQFFRYDGLGRLVKSWDNTGGYTETNPKSTYDYLFGSDIFPGKVFEETNFEKTDGVYGLFETLHLSTAKGKSLATLIEVPTAIKVTGLSDHNAQTGEVSVFSDHLISNGIDLTQIKRSDFDFINNPRLQFEKKDFFGGSFDQAGLKQESTEQNFAFDKIVQAGSVVEIREENNNSNLRVEKHTNSFGQLTRYIDEESNIYDYEYDALNRLRRVTFPGGEVQTVTYGNNLGKVIAVDRTNIGSFEYVYDSVSTLLNSKAIRNSAGVLETEELSTYDLIGRETGRTLNQYNPDGTLKETLGYSFTYDGDNLDPSIKEGNQGFLTEVIGPTFTKKMVYRPDEKLLTEEITAFNEIEIGMDYTYFSQREPRSVNIRAKNIVTNTQIADYTFNYEYDRFGNLVRKRLDSAIFSDFFYNDFNEVSLIDIIGEKLIRYTYDTQTREARDYLELDGSTTLMKQLISYNNRGFITNSSFEFNAQTSTETYAYRETGWLDTFSRTMGGVSEQLSYDYDSFGLMSEVIRNGSSEPHLITPSSWSIAGINYGLDQLGRVTSRGAKSFTYGPNRRIQEVRNGGVLLSSHFYDEAHNPVTKTYPDGRKEVYFGDMVFADDHLLNPLALGSRNVGYFKDGVFKRTSQNHLNTHVLDENDALKSSTPFGERAGSRSEVSNVLDFTLKGYDQEIEAVRMGRRFYDPKAKRFLAADSYFFRQPGDLTSKPMEGNLYSYAINNPISITDPTGNCGDCFVDMAGLAAGFDSIQKWNSKTSFSSKVLDVVGVAVDGIGLAVPGVAVGAGLGLKYARSVAKANLVKDIQKSAQAGDKAGLTRAGRSLQKHSDRVGSVFKASDKKPATLNKEGIDVVNKILNDSKSSFKHRDIKVNGEIKNVVDITSSNGQGLRYNKTDNKFVGFREP